MTPQAVRTPTHCHVAAEGSTQPRDVLKEKAGAMNTIMQDGLRVTAANRQAWIEICTCPLSLVRCHLHNPSFPLA